MKLNLTYIIIFLNYISFSQNIFVPGGIPPTEIKLTDKNFEKIFYRNDSVTKIDFNSLDFNNKFGLKYPDKCKDGKYIIFYNNDTSSILTSFQYKNTLKFSTFKIYYKNKNVEYSMNYFLGKKNGLYEKYNVNGRLEFFENYIDDKLNGTSITYYENGLKRSEVTFRNDKVHGLSKTWTLFPGTGKIEYKEEYFLDGKKTNSLK